MLLRCPIWLGIVLLLLASVTSCWKYFNEKLLLVLHLLSSQNDTYLLFFYLLQFQNLSSMVMAMINICFRRSSKGEIFSFFISFWVYIVGDMSMLQWCNCWVILVPYFCSSQCFKCYVAAPLSCQQPANKCLLFFFFWVHRVVWVETVKMSPLCQQNTVVD